MNSNWIPGPERSVAECCVAPSAWLLLPTRISPGCDRGPWGAGDRSRWENSSSASKDWGVLSAGSLCDRFPSAFFVYQISRAGRWPAPTVPPVEVQFGGVGSTRRIANLSVTADWSCDPSEWSNKRTNQMRRGCLSRISELAARRRCLDVSRGLPESRPPGELRGGGV